MIDDEMTIADPGLMSSTDPKTPPTSLTFIHGF